MRSLTVCLLTFALALPLTPSVVSGEITREMHPWGRFEPGAWKLVRVVTETFEEGGAIASAVETKTTLNEVGENDVTLLVHVSVDVGGKQFDADPQKVVQGFHGEVSSPQVKVTDLPDAELEIQGLTIPCQVQQLEVDGPTHKTVTEVYFSESVEPHILKRQSKTTDAEGKVLSETTVDVIALSVPTRVGRAILTAAHLKAVHTHAKGTTTTSAITCMEVPGGVVCHSLSELDESGRMVRRSSMELLDYGLDPDEEDRGGFFRRRRARATRSPSRYYVPR